ncbi:class III poly(R)-hydroxyalkanoic acid synthase subunit PhaC [Solemya velum gill symbiont]|uniref:class III poly(R)-hydroxyalkanoic acid synthase subunit PhaC n=1 Tax=Solemya velum gill symbiont TaxID=2340 RepID=UPI00351DA025
MMNFRPDQIAEELYDFNRKLGSGLQSMSEVGEISTGVTPYDVVYEEDNLRLVRYKADEGTKQNKVPMLIVYALVNRPYMADIQENRSTVKGLLDSGQDVYLIDWGFPDRCDRFLTLDDYINGYINRCVDVIRKESGQDAINLLGICQGGAFSLCYSAMHPHKVKNLVTMVTPVDFKTEDNMLSKWVQDVDIDLCVDTLGNIPGDMLNLTFLQLKPYQLTGQKYLSLVDILDNPSALKNFLRMEKWVFDSPDQAGEAYRQFVKDFFQHNKLVEGGLKIGDHEVDLKNTTMPILNVYADQDHLVPPDASKALAKLTGSKDYTEFNFAGGHIGIYVSGKAQKTVPPTIGEWLDKRS